MTLKSTDEERREIYRALDIKRKIENGQVYMRTRRLHKGPPSGDFPEGTRSRLVEIYLTENDWYLCLAQHYIRPDGTDHTEPDPKYLRIDNLILKQNI